MSSEMDDRIPVSSEMEDRIPGVDWRNWTEGKRVKMTKKDLQEGRFQAVMHKQVTLVYA